MTFPILSSASDVRVAKLIVMVAIAVVTYLIVPLIRRIRDNAKKNQKEKIEGGLNSLDGGEYYKMRGKRFLLFAFLSFVGAILMWLLGTSVFFEIRMVFLVLLIMCLLASLVFLVLSIVNFVKSNRGY